MDAQTAIIVLGFLASAVVLFSASVLDWRTRRVGNVFWITLSVAALILLTSRILVDDAPLEYLLVIAPVLAVLSDIYLDLGEKSRVASLKFVAEYGVAVGSTICLAYMWAGDDYFVHLLTVPVMMLLVVLMYAFDIIRGGADAKALIALSIMFPFYPDIGSFPMISSDASYAEVFFPFSFVVLINAAIMVAFAPLLFVTRNLAAREFEYPFGFLGYRMDTNSARTSHVWVMERMVNGELRRFTRPKRGEDLSAELALLEEAGHKRVWVTPKIPFIIPIFASLIFTAIVGNLLVLIIGI